MAVLLTACYGMEKITDTDTSPEVKFVDPQENSLLLEWHNDYMNRGDHEYETLSHPPLVIDTNDKKVKRGDVIYFKTPEFTIESNPDFKRPEFLISRVVGLEGETVEIKKGQVFIDGKKLDTFYSKALMSGMDQKEYFEKVERANRGDDETTKEYFETTLKPVKVKKNTVFVLGDNWGRSVDSINFGVLPLDNLEGKVLGYKK